MSYEDWDDEEDLIDGVGFADPGVRYRYEKLLWEALERERMRER